jgi:hypothetical protein
MIYSDYSTNPRDVIQTPLLQDAQDRLGDLKRALWGDALGSAESFREVVRSTRLFEDHGEVVEAYIKGEFK